MRITSKGQVTLPVDIREKAGLMPDTDVDFEFDGHVVRLVPSRVPVRISRGARRRAAAGDRRCRHEHGRDHGAHARRWVSGVLADSNVLLDLMTEDERWFPWSASAVEHAASTSRLVINPIVYAEISVRYARAEDLDAVLPRGAFEREAIPYEAAFLAGKCFAIYRRRRGAKSSPLPDFFIGARAAVAGYRLLTRDAARYRTYFPKMDLIAPT